MNSEQISMLIGKNVEMVCFARFAVYLHLEGGILLTVESEFEHTHDETGAGLHTTFPAEASDLMTVLESSVSSASADASGGLHLSFLNGDTVSVSKEPGFESYRIRIAGEEHFA